MNRRESDKTSTGFKLVYGLFIACVAIFIVALVIVKITKTGA